MLKLRHLYENERLARSALQNWPHDEDTLDRLLSQYRISANAVYPFSRDGKTCYLRLAPRDEKLERNIYGELEFINYLRASGFPALKPIQSASGELVLNLTTEWGDYYATAFERVAGIPVNETDYSGSIMTAYGKALGRLHALSSVYKPAVRKWSHEDVLAWIGKTLTEYEAPAFAHSAVRRLSDELQAFPVNDTVYGLVHYDFEPDNVFYDDAADRCSVIDFDDGMYHWFALDAEQAFDALADELPPTRLGAAIAAFVEGYRTERPYPADMEAMRPAMRRFCNLLCYARLIRSVAERSDNEPDWLVALRIKLDGKIRRLESAMQDA